jgi:peptidoglycan hydrolase-like protein with peptidoglycan-binding domain
MRRNLIVGLVLVAILAAAGVGWLLGSSIQSPAEVAAQAEPPEPSLITVEVKQIELTTRVIVRGDIVYDEPEQVGLSGSMGPTVEAPVVTLVLEEGMSLEEGDLALEIAGRPVLVLEGEIPMYRDLRPGSRGIDVEQLELALERLGYFEETPDEIWGTETADALQAWYGEVGYAPEGPTEAQLAELEAARDRVDAATAEVRAAEQDLARAKQGPSQSTLLAMQASVTMAEDNLAAAQREQSLADAAAAQTVTEAESALTAAQDAETLAQDRYDQAVGGTHPDTGLPPTPEELAELEAILTEATTSVADATEIRDQALINQETIALQQESLVRQAQSQLDIAKAELAELQAPPDTTFETARLVAAREALAEAKADRSEVEGRAGIWLPAGHIVFLDRLPVRIDRLAVKRGDQVGGTFMTVSGANLAVRSSIAERDAANVSEGMEVLVWDEFNETELTGIISSKALRSGTQGVASDRVYIEIEPEFIPTELVGANVRITIPLKTSGGEVLAVPAAALSATADGSTHVEIDEGGETPRRVTVEPGLSTSGLVEITPLDGSIKPGDLVVVGYAPAE